MSASPTARFEDIVRSTVNDEGLQRWLAGHNVCVHDANGKPMHLQGLILRQKKPLRVMHIAEILAGRSAPS